MNKFSKSALLHASILALGSFAFSQSAFAQEGEPSGIDTTEATIEQIDEISDDRQTGDQDEIVVTGSRMKRDTFSSVAPLQVITGDVSREAGLIDPVDILQGSTAASGQQVDLTFNGFVLDNGPGASTVALRNLGAARTLLLLNGRRMAPAGVEGAPAEPDANLIPQILVDRTEILLDGASSVYGSDAIAGVGNVILKKDFDGFTIEGFIDESQHGGGSRTIAGSYGWNSDRSFIGIGGEYSDRDEIKMSDRPWTADCDTFLERDENGKIRREGLVDPIINQQRPTECARSGSFVGRIWSDTSGFGSLYFTEGQSNTHIPNFTDSHLLGAPLDYNGDGYADVQFADYMTGGNDAYRSQESLYGGLKRYNIMAYGETNISVGDTEIKPYFEALFANRETFAYSDPSPFFSDVVAENPYNPCGVNGVDCGLAHDATLQDPEYISSFQAYYNGGPGSATCFGFTPAFGIDYCNPTFIHNYYLNAFGVDIGWLTGPTGPQSVQPQIAVTGDRNYVKAEVNQLRLVGGMKFDMPFMKFGGEPAWETDVTLMHSRSNGDSLRRGINEKKLNFALGQEFNASGDVIATGGACQSTDSTNLAGSSNYLTAEEQAGCVPVNLFSPTLYSPIVGDFATEAERNYVFSDRTFDTTYKQTILSGYMTGNLGEFPGGKVTAVLGGEIRWDDLESNPNKVAADGELWGFFKDEGADGDKRTEEVYGEIALPFAAGQPFMEQFDVELSGRYTHDEYYGSAGTYSGKVGWRPATPLLLRATLGTSFRAPNLRELFMKNQSGFSTAFDPCSTPDNAVGPFGEYIPANDSREDLVLQNCVEAGIDPTNFRVGTPATSVEIFRSGVLFDPQVSLKDLDPETSQSLTLGFSFEQPFWDSFDLTVGASYYSIELNDIISELSASYVVSDCYEGLPDLQSPRCGNVTRDSDGNLDSVVASFENLGTQRTSGWDFNATFGKELILGSRLFDLGLDLQMNKLNKLEYETTDKFSGVTTTNDYAGYHSYGIFAPDWRGKLRGFVGYKDWRFVWNTDYIDGTKDWTPPEYSNIYEGDAATCEGPDDGDVNCIRIEDIKGYWTNSASVYWRKGDWVVGGGIRNIFDQEPPEVDPNSRTYNKSNTPFSYGYDLNGRSFFANLSKKF